jgi:hypothetical protein
MEEEIKSEMPEWLKKIDDDTYEVTTKDGVFVMSDVPYERTEHAMAKSEKTGMYAACVLAEAIKSKNGKEERIGELEIQKYKTSTVMRLQHVINEVLGVADFQKPSNKK